MHFRILFFSFFLFTNSLLAQKPKVLFDASKAQMAGNADWVVDADKFNVVNKNGKMTVGGNGESNPQRFPSPSASGINKTTPETYWKGAISAWAVELVKRGCEVETLPVDGKITYGDKANPQDLSNYAVFITCEPNVKFTQQEQTALVNFIKNGSGLFFVGDHAESDRNNDGCDSPCVWNNFSASAGNIFGISFNTDKINEVSKNVVLADKPLINGAAGKVTSIKFSAGASLNIDNSKNSTAKGVIYRSSANAGGAKNALCAYSVVGNGRVVVLGDSSPADDGTGDIKDTLYTGWQEENGNHARLIINATLWLLKR